MSVIDTQSFAIPSDPKDREKIAAVFKDMSQQLVKCEATKEYVKDAKKALKEEFEIPANVINTMFRVYHADNAASHFEEQREMEALYDALFEEPNDE